MKYIIKINKNKWNEIKEIYKIDKDIDENEIIEMILAEGFGVEGMRGQIFENWKEYKKNVKIKKG